LGFVKTRLAKDVGPAQALAIYRLLVERQCTALPHDARIEIHFTPRDAGREMSEWLGEEFSYYPQSDGGLGERLACSVNAAFERGARSVTCIGGDCPQLKAHHFHEANERMDAGDDVVFGPSEDGGYYLVALGQAQPQIFTEIPWSQPNTLDVSLKKAAQLGLKVSLLETLYDVDEVATMNRAVKDGRIEFWADY
jgi:rSAM/selenodomain-associated transferase 1